LVCLRQDVLTGGMDGVGLAVLHLVRGHQADADMMVILVVPSEEAAAEGPGILDAAETFGELRLVFQMGWTAPLTASMCQSAGCQNLQQGSRPQ
jgi:hypothetical protein